MRNKICLVLLLLNTVILRAQDNHWSVNVNDYQYDMTVYATFSQNGEPVADLSNYEVAAFVGNECRGIATVQSITKEGKTYYWYYLRIRSNSTSGEKVKFKVYDKQNDKVRYVGESLDFASSAAIGQPSTPIILSQLIFTPGDVNDDGKAFINDVAMIINYLIGNVPDNFKEYAADYNADGQILINDVTMIINNILGK